MKERFDIDPAHTDVGFSIKHLVISKVRGSFTGVRGYIDLDQQDANGSDVHVRVDMATIDTNDADRDAHLKSADFFDVEHYPEMTFDSTSVRGTLEELQVVGDLTIHGVTKSVVLDSSFGGRVKDPWGNERIGFEATTTIDRKDFGLTWNAPLEAGGVLVGDKVQITIETEAVKATQQPAEQQPAGATTYR